MASNYLVASEEVNTTIPCPICNKVFEKFLVEEHVNKCLFLNSSEDKVARNESNNIKRSNSHFSNTSSVEKRFRHTSPSSTKQMKVHNRESDGALEKNNKLPLAEQMRPRNIEDIVGQVTAFGPGTMLRSVIEQKKIPNMILWGPPGCGKTSLANVICNICKEQNNMRFVKLSATMSGISDVKEVVKIAKNEAQFKRQTILFMDEIHRFNKLQQDTFLPHVENGTIILIGATTENPSFSLTK